MTLLWNGVSNMTKISWLKWSTVCTPKQMGGLGIKNLSIFNISLLVKWHWHFLVETEAIWALILKF